MKFGNLSPKVVGLWVRSALLLPISSQPAGGSNLKCKIEGDLVLSRLIWPIYCLYRSPKNLISMDFWRGMACKAYKNFGAGQQYYRNFFVWQNKSCSMWTDWMRIGWLVVPIAVHKSSMNQINQPSNDILLRHPCNVAVGIWLQTVTSLGGCVALQGANNGDVPLQDRLFFWTPHYNVRQFQLYNQIPFLEQRTA